MAIAKKTVRKPGMVRPAAKPAAAQTPCACTSGCASGCGCCKGRFFKKLIVLLLVFAAGWAVACFVGCRNMHKGPRWSFDENGCLDVSKIKCDKMAEKIAAADADNDGCITKAELKAFRMEKKGN